jgi:predicted nucleic acid-binding protein
MSAAIFVDTNVFVYSRQSNEPLKQPRAQQWIERLWKDQRGRTSLQVISETYVTLTRKIRPALPQDQAWEYVRTLFAWNPQALDEDVARGARLVEQRYGLSWWDSLIVSAAQIQNCAILLSEDMKEGAAYGSVTVRSPFSLHVAEEETVYAAEVMPTHRARGRPQRRIAA